jgi:quinol monooxygenase YgiN
MGCIYKVYEKHPVPFNGTILEVTMIIRLFHAKVRAGRQAEFKKVLELLSLPTVQSRKGMVAFYPGQPVGPNLDEFVLVTVWKDLKHLENYSLEEWAKTIIPEEALPLLEEWRVDGYKSFGILEQPLKPLFQNI